MFRLLGKLFGKRAAPRINFPAFNRGYEELEVDRLLSDWFRDPSADPNKRLVQHLPRIRGLARSLAETNKYAVRYLDLRVSNVVGDKGFKFQSKVSNADKSPDKFARDTIEARWMDWQEPENCTVAGDKYFCDLERLVERSLAADGEAFLWVLPGFDNDHRFAVKAFEPDWIDIEFCEKLKNGNQVIMGKEYTPAGKCVAFWVNGAHPGAMSETFGGGNKRSRIPALCEFMRSDLRVSQISRAGYILHQFEERRAGQARGVPEITHAIETLRHLDRTEEAHAIGARISSSIGFQEVSTVADEYESDPDQRGSLEIKPGFIATPAKGKKFEVLNPSFPNASLPDHGKYTLKGAGMSLGVSYPTFSGDLEGTSYSSGRTGALAERDGFKIRQQFSINSRFRPTFNAWLRCQLLFELMAVGKMDDVGTTGEKRLRASHVQARRWDWVDPAKDATAKLLELRGRLNSPQRVLAERGLDLEEILKEWEDYEAMVSDAGLEPTEFRGIEDLIQMLPHLSDEQPVENIKATANHG